VRRKSGNRALVCSGCGWRVHGIAEVYGREVRNLPCLEYRTTVVIELYRLQCPGCGLKTEKVPHLPSKAPFSKRFEDAAGEACESAAARMGRSCMHSGGLGGAYADSPIADGLVNRYEGRSHGVLATHGKSFAAWTSSGFESSTRWRYDHAQRGNSDPMLRCQRSPPFTSEDSRRFRFLPRAEVGSRRPVAGILHVPAHPGQDNSRASPLTPGVRRSLPPVPR